MARKKSAKTRFIHLAAKSLLILLVGSGAGFAFNALSEDGIPLRLPSRIPLSDQVGWSLHMEGLRASLEEAKEGYDRRNVVFVDARPRGAYIAGHIPGAINLPVSQFRRRGREAMADVPKDAHILTYCSGGSCQSSASLAGLLTERLGYANTRVFYNGWQAWVEAGYPTVTGETP